MVPRDNPLVFAFFAEEAGREEQTDMDRGTETEGQRERPWQMLTQEETRSLTHEPLVTERDRDRHTERETQRERHREREREREREKGEGGLTGVNARGDQEPCARTTCKGQ